MNRICLIILSLCFLALTSSAQNDRDYIRRGNRIMRDTVDIQKKSEKAIIQYRKAVDSNPDNPIAHYNLACAQLRRGNPQEAINEFQKAGRLEKDPKRLSDIYHNIGLILYLDKQYDKAVVAYRECLRRDPDNNESRYNYLMALYMLGKNPPQQDKQKQDKDDKQKQQQDKKEQQKQQKQQKPKQDRQNPQEQKAQPRPDQMSKENAEQLLKAVMQNEKNTQQKVQRAQQNRPERHLHKQW
ncbi:MAG: tetratricopeptide repeat protein [Bacteroidaceae bacterium]|nr:tetratricopeptide repeat protein [Bacteroidaceae bacterium]